ncbi:MULTISPECIES: hypothetical protein [unclassified Sphingomonas]|nr:MULTISPECIES: hypothetical protein [unclassified Sphingomonas]
MGLLLPEDRADAFRLNPAWSPRGYEKAAMVKTEHGGSSNQ